MGNIEMKINGRTITVPEDTTILEAALQNSISIPTLCFLKNCNEIGACRMCVVEIRGNTALKPACVTKVAQGIEIYTDSEVVRESRRQTLELLCANHRMDCEFCSRYSDCEFHALCREYFVDTKAFELVYRPPEEDLSARNMIRDNSKCLLCRRCVSTCREEGMQILSVVGKGSQVHIGAALNIDDMGCIQCGQCVSACPTGALREKDDTQQVWKAINHHKHVVAVVSPFVSAAVGELLWETGGANVSGKLVSMLHKMGFAKVVSQDQLAASYIPAAVQELSERRKAAGGLPVISSECPGLANLCRQRYPQLKSFLSALERPVEQFSREYKAKYVQDTGAAKDDVMVVAVEPCLAAKDAYRTVDVVLTTRELAAMIKRAGVSRFSARYVWERLPDEPFDSVAETETEKVYGARGEIGPALAAQAETDGIKYALFTGMKDVCAALQEISSGHHKYDYYDLMICPQGCAMGGGQPRLPSSPAEKGRLLQLRKSAFATSPLGK